MNIRENRNRDKRNFLGGEAELDFSSVPLRCARSLFCLHCSFVAVSRLVPPMHKTMCTTSHELFLPMAWTCSTLRYVCTPFFFHDSHNRRKAPDFITAIDSDMSMTHFLIEIVDTYGNTLDRSQVYLHHLVITSPTVRNLACPGM